MLIDHTNFATLLKESTSPRGSAPNGNVYFDTANNRIQLIGANELATVNFGAGPVTNPLNNFDGVTMRALYNFENNRRRVNDTLRKFKRGIKGSYRFSGAYNFVNGVKLDGTDRAKVRGSGFVEYAATGDGETAIDRVYHGVLSLVDIQATSVPYWALVANTTEATLQAATWTNFVRQGDINEVVQVFGSTANGDTGAGSFDYRERVLVVRVRSWGYNPGETTSVASGITEFSGFNGGYGLGESLNPANSFALADVFGGAAVSPFTGLSLELKGVPEVGTGFNEGNGNFTWVLNNSAGASVAQCAAYLDAVSLQDTDIDAGAGMYNGKKGRVWYTRNASGQVVTASIGGKGLLVKGLSPAESQKIVMTDDAGTQRTYPFFPTVEIDVGSVAPTDPNAWYAVFYDNGAGSADFDTATAVLVNDAAGNPVTGNVAADVAGTKIAFAYGFDTNTQAGLPAGVDKAMVALVEGDGVAAQAFSRFTTTRSTLVAVTCAPVLDNNA